MKRAGTLFVAFFISSQLFAQNNEGEVFSKQIPIESQLQIGFMFVYGLLAILFLMLYAFYPRQRLNLFFGLFNLCLFVARLRSPSLTGEPFTNVDRALNNLVGVNILLFIAHALGRTKPFIWWFVAFLLLVDLPLQIFLGDRYQFVNQAVRGLFAALCGWLMVVAFTTKKRENWLIGIMALVAVYFNLSAALVHVAKVDIGRYVGIVPFMTVIPAVCYLALRYARTNTFLEQQLVQVKDLSEENARREQEKRQLLATQNEMLERQVKQRTAEITAQKETLEHTLKELRSTQAQLIQSEKMASLGELTAGIAHEIQNPLNFVNNFSEVNGELVDELKSKLAVGNMQSAIEIADDIKKNEQKINQHGKRADSIVKGMLQHSRTSSRQAELTDINALCDEYLRLAFHGFKAKENAFSAKVETDFDNTIGTINIIPQDIGRVILNLINNAFYAVSERQKMEGVGYEPKITVATKTLTDKVLISVADNGNGIQQKILDKIFQPFFTTKPTGQGTGLGLSLAYDIVKAHGGDIKVESKEGEGSEFIIQLHVNVNP